MLAIVSISLIVEATLWDATWLRHASRPPTRQRKQIMVLLSIDLIDSTDSNQFIVCPLSVRPSRRPSLRRRPSSVRPSHRVPPCPVAAVVVRCPSVRLSHRRPSSVRPSHRVLSSPSSYVLCPCVRPVRPSRRRPSVRPSPFVPSSSSVLNPSVPPSVKLLLT